MAEQAVSKLRDASFDVTKLSIIGRDYHTDEKVVGYYTTGERMKYWGVRGAFWGGIWGLLLGAGLVWAIRQYLDELAKRDGAKPS